jgi:hypothetical protein
MKKTITFPYWISAAGDQMWGGGSPTVGATFTRPSVGEPPQLDSHTVWENIARVLAFICGAFLRVHILGIFTHVLYQLGTLLTWAHQKRWAMDTCIYQWGSWAHLLYSLGIFTRPYTSWGTFQLELTYSRGHSQLYQLGSLQIWGHLQSGTCTSWYTIAPGLTYN